MHFCSAYNMGTFNSNNINHNKRILKTIADFDLQKVLNYGVTAKKYDLVHTTLWRKHMSQVIFKSEAIIKFWQKLNKAQKKFYLAILGTLWSKTLFKPQKRYTEASWASTGLSNLYTVIHSILKACICKI